VKWRLWHGRLDRAIRDLQDIVTRLLSLRAVGDLSAARLRTLGSQLLTYIRSNRDAIINYGKRYRAGLRVATTLAESAVNSLVAKRMVKKQQMRWSQHGAHILMQVRTAEMNGELRDRMRARFREPDPNVPPLFKPQTTPPASRLTPEKLSVSAENRAALLCQRGGKQGGAENWASSGRSRCRPSSWPAIATGGSRRRSG